MRRLSILGQIMGIKKFFKKISDDLDEITDSMALRDIQNRSRSIQRKERKAKKKSEVKKTSSKKSVDYLYVPCGSSFMPIPWDWKKGSPTWDLKENKSKK